MGGTEHLQKIIVGAVSTTALMELALLDSSVESATGVSSFAEGQ